MPPTPSEPETPSVPETIPNTLVSVVDSVFYEPEQLADAICSSPATATWLTWFPGLNNTVLPMLRGVVNRRIPRLDSLFNARVGRASDGSRQWQVETYVFHYRSVDAKGESVVLSGRVTVPNNTLGDTPHQLSTFSLVSHQYEMMYDWAPSSSLNLMDARVFYNSAVISPDYQGLGVDHLVHPVASIVFPSQSRQMADCVAAAIRLLSDRGITLADDGHTTNWGSSLGSPAALEFSRYYEEEASTALRDALRLSSTFVCEGPLDAVATFRYANEHQDKDCCLYLFLPYLSSLSTMQTYGYKIGDFMAPWMDSVVVNYYGKDLTYIQLLASSTPYNGSQFYPQGYRMDLFPAQFSPDMLTEGDSLDYASPKVQALMAVYEKYSNFKGYHPRLPIYIGHCLVDEHVPYEVARQSYEQLRRQSDGTIADNVRWLEIPSPGNYVANTWGGTHYAVSMLSLLYMMCSPEPADMANFYTLE